MSVRTTQQNVASKTLRGKPLTPWVRNPSWPAIPTVLPTDQKFVGLWAVYNDGSSFIALSAAGAYKVDFGDGSAVQNIATGVQANYQYNYSSASLVGTEAPVTLTVATGLVNRTAHGYTNNMLVRFYSVSGTTDIIEAQPYYVVNATANTFQISATQGGTALPLTMDGTANLLPYRVAIVTVTPQAGNLTSLSLYLKHSQALLQSGYTTGWLDIAMAGSMTVLSIGSTLGTIRHSVLERANIVACLATSFSGLLGNCYSLRSVSIGSTGVLSSTQSMFQNCYNLPSVPLFNTATVNNMSAMFSNCYSLQSVPLFNTANVTTMSSMFSSCANLPVVPLFNTVNVTNMASMFTSCCNLSSVPLFNTQNVTNMNSMFTSCISLQSIPLFNTVKVTDMGGMFSSCTSLQTVPLFNTVALTTMSSMFSGCYSLPSVPLFNTQNVLSMNNTFASCTSLQTVPLFNTVKVTDMTNMFTSCTSLLSVPLFNTAAATTMSSMFNSCTSLQSVPLFNTATVANMSSMFIGCNSLQTVPAMTAAAVLSANLSNIFLTCPSLSSILMTGFKFSFTVASCKLSGAALNTLYNGLASGVSGQTITVSNNWGTATDDPTIATAKGWTVTGS